MNVYLKSVEHCTGIESQWSHMNFSGVYKATIASIVQLSTWITQFSHLLIIILTKKHDVWLVSDLKKMMAQQYEVEMLGSQSQVTTLGEQTIENTFNNIIKALIFFNLDQ